MVDLDGDMQRSIGEQLRLTGLKDGMRVEPSAKPFNGGDLLRLGGDLELLRDCNLIMFAHGL